jgi:hypothetical protein
MAEDTSGDRDGGIAATETIGEEQEEKDCQGRVHSAVLLLAAVEASKFSSVREIRHRRSLKTFSNLFDSLPFLLFIYY